MTLQKEERQALINYRIQRSLESLQEAKTVFALSLNILAVNRLYYAVFYACMSLLISEGIVTSTHAGVRSLILEKYVKKGPLNKEERRLVADLFTMQLTEDSGDYFAWSEEDIDPLIPRTEELINKLISFTEQN